MPVAPTFFTRSARIGLSPWSAEKMDQAELTALESRAAALDVTVSTIRRSDKQWMVRVHHNGQTTSLVARGPIAAIISGALDDFEAAA